MWISDDGRYLYQAYGLAGVVGVYAIDGAELTLLQETRGDLPLNNIQGIVSVGIIGELSATDDLITDVESLQLNLFPSPSAGDELNVEFILDEVSDYEISVFDIRGQVISEGQIKGQGVTGENLLTIDDLSLESGFYLLQLNLEQGSVTKKFVVQK